MLNFRVIARVFSLVLIFEGIFMAVSGCVSLLYRDQGASAFFYSALVTIVTGIIVFTPLRNEERIYGNKEGYIIVTGIWLLFTLFGTLPFLFSGTVKSFGDAFFESMSGFSTTGATIFTNVESLPHGILFWRSLTQWLGGIGIILISLSVLPVVKSINIQLTASDFSGQPTDKIQPRIKDAAKRLVLIYSIITLAEIVLLVIGKMPVFDAICHSFSTLSTGGFSVRNNGIAEYSSPYLMIIMTLFMFISGTNMALIYFGLKGNFRKITGNNEFIFYTVICLVFVLAGFFILHFNSGLPPGKSILNSSFHIISIITTTGYYTENYNLWGNAMIIILFILMFSGGTAGSTSGSIKIVRLLLLTKNNRQELKRIIHPSGFLPVRLDRHIIPQSTVYNVLVFITLYFFIICLGTFLISLMGYDMVTSFSSSASMLGNIGPGIGTFGPFTNYSAVPMTGKWLMSFMMLLGRLELFTVMLLFTRNFYRS
jgi:trk system potassium uptake protein TrkH